MAFCFKEALLRKFLIALFADQETLPPLATVVTPDAKARPQSDQAGPVQEHQGVRNGTEGARRLTQSARPRGQPPGRRTGQWHLRRPPFHGGLFPGPAPAQQREELRQRADSRGAGTQPPLLVHARGGRAGRHPEGGEGHHGQVPEGRRGLFGGVGLAVRGHGSRQDLSDQFHGVHRRVDLSVAWIGPPSHGVMIGTIYL